MNRQPPLNRFLKDLNRNTSLRISLQAVERNRFFAVAGRTPEARPNPNLNHFVKSWA